MSERPTTNGSSNHKLNAASVPTIEFQPQLNGSYRVRFADAYKKQGFAVLSKGGMFHCFFPGIYLITAHHRQLLEESGVPFEVI